MVTIPQDTSTIYFETLLWIFHATNMIENNSFQSVVMTLTMQSNTQLWSGHLSFSTSHLLHMFKPFGVVVATEIYLSIGSRIGK